MTEIVAGITEVLTLSFSTGGAVPVSFTLGGLAITGALFGVAIAVAKKVGLRR
jgi:hypothetical protein